MSSMTDMLCSMELYAQRAIVQELRLMCSRLRALRTTLAPDDLDHADALLLKLEHLEAQQATPCAWPSGRPRYLAPDLVIAAPPVSVRSVAEPACASALAGI